VESEAPRPKGVPTKPLKRRELQRRRAKTRRLILPAIAILVAGATLGAAILLSPPPPPPHETGPGEIISNSPMHIHPQLTILNLGAPVTIPASIGIQGGPYADHSLDHWLDQREGQVGSLAPIHTHDASGLIHVEASVTRGFTLGEFFSVWGQPLGPSQTTALYADAHHRLTLTSNGVLVANTEAAWHNLVLKDSQDIVIKYEAY
jgi:hypothetical protein